MEIASLHDIEFLELEEDERQESERPYIRFTTVAAWILMLVNFTIGVLLLYRIFLRLVFIYPVHPPTWYNAGYQVFDFVMGCTFIALGLDLFLKKAAMRRHTKMAAVIAIAFSGVNTLYIYHRCEDVLEAGLGTLTFADLARFLILVSGYYLGARALRGEPVIRRETFALTSLILLSDAVNYIVYFKLPYILLVQPEAFAQTRMLIQAIQMVVIIAAAALSLNLFLRRTPRGGAQGPMTLPWYVKGGLFMFGLHFILWGLQEVLVNKGPLMASFSIHPTFALAPLLQTFKGVAIAVAALYPWEIPIGRIE